MLLNKIYKKLIIKSMQECKKIEIKDKGKLKNKPRIQPKPENKQNNKKQKKIELKEIEKLKKNKIGLINY